MTVKSEFIFVILHFKIAEMKSSPDVMVIADGTFSCVRLSSTLSASLLSPCSLNDTGRMRLLLSTVKAVMEKKLYRNLMHLSTKLDSMTWLK